jgi:hypothetical protein
MHASVRAALLALLLALPASAVAEPQRPGQPPPAPAPSKTGKERQGGKASDEQRVDDCKVPVERRTRPRPAACPPASGS